MIYLAHSALFVFASIVQTCTLEKDFYALLSATDASAFVQIRIHP